MNEKHFTQLPGYHYILFSPEDVYASEKIWPLIVFLHGAGERGHDLELLKKQGLPRLLRSRRSFPFVVAAPQLPNNEYWTPSMVEELIPQVSEQFRIDQDRVYLTGISMGGFGTWMTAIDCPEQFAALVPICGGGDPSAVSAIRSVPVWAFHGARDPIVPISESETMVEALKKAGGNVRFTAYSNGEHDVWTQTYANEELYQWLLSHDRKEQTARRKAS